MFTERNLLNNKFAINKSQLAHNETRHAIPEIRKENRTQTQIILK